MTEQSWSRRNWIRATACATACSMALPGWGRAKSAIRDYHVCLAPPVVEGEPELLDIVREAGVGCVWLAGYFYGHHPYSQELVQRAFRRVERAGMEPCLITVPLGHPGDSLGAKDGDFPLTPPSHWRVGERPDGKSFTGTSLHRPATEENAMALKQLRRLGFRRGFLDDDFRVARGPGEIGGCFCAGHRTSFLRKFGHSESMWNELLDDVRCRRLTSVLRNWLEFTGLEMTASFRSQESRFRGQLGVMVMYLGSEKAGLRLGDYRDVPFRVGELMFEDAAFTPVKGKTDELFSALFHRRFASPERAYSETTAYPANRLSASNLAAKLVISTLADVRHTMFMSGLTPFPRGHWSVLGPAMRVQSDLHREIAGQRMQGPLKHYWGEAQRLVGDDLPFSLWLAMGVPFEVVDRIPGEGWVFLSDFDVREWTPARKQERLICRSTAPNCPPTAEKVEETLAGIFALKNRLRPQLGSIPHIEEDLPAVCAWYPAVGKVLVWNLSEQRRLLTVKNGTRRIADDFSALEAKVVRIAES